jgi:hypothetical protein
VTGPRCATVSDIGPWPATLFDEARSWQPSPPAKFLQTAEALHPHAGPYPCEHSGPYPCEEETT